MSWRVGNGGNMRRNNLARRRAAHLAVESLERRLCLAAATINWNSLQQTIAGFGSSSAWNNTGSVDSSQQQLLWSAIDGAGLSMLRSRIRPDTSSSSDEISAIACQVFEITGSKIINHCEVRVREFLLQRKREIRSDEAGATGDNEVGLGRGHRISSFRAKSRNPVAH